MAAASSKLCLQCANKNAFARLLFAKKLQLLSASAWLSDFRDRLFDDAFRHLFIDNLLASEPQFIHSQIRTIGHYFESACNFTYKCISELRDNCLWGLEGVLKGTNDWLKWYLLNHKSRSIFLDDIFLMQTLIPF